MKDTRKLRRLARQLRHRIGHLKPQADRCWSIFKICQPAFRCVRLAIALSGYECAILMWVNYRRLKAVQAEINRRSNDQ